MASVHSNGLHEYYGEVIVEGIKKWQCGVCYRTLSTKQRVEYHVHSVHHKGPVERKYKRYRDDPNIPVPKRTKYNWKFKARSNADNEDAVSDTIDESFNSDGSTTFNQQGEDQDSSYEDVDNSDLDSDKSSDFEFSDSESLANSFDCQSLSSSCDEDDSHPDVSDTVHPSFTAKEMASMAVIAFATRYLLSDEAASSCVELIKKLCPENATFHELSYTKIQQISGNCSLTVVDYCECCFALFPDDKDLYQCSTVGCPGLRYKGSVARQWKKQAKTFFVSVDVGNQLQDLLERNGVWESVQERVQLRYRSNNANKAITDILDGKYYQEYCKEGNFLADSRNLSIIFNTDGAPLFQSSGISLWPVFLAINEIPPAERFSKKNMLIWGLWQGKGKPPFNTYFEKFAVTMNELYNTGIDVLGSAGSVQVKAAVILSSDDLQAKAYLLNQTQHNGEAGCSTCEETGCVVKQGKGSTRCYPFREHHEVPKRRTTDSILENGYEAHVHGKRTNGFYNVTSLALMPYFDLVMGIVPDYMHGVLLGITKTLMYNWFSATKTKKPYFIGKEITLVNQRLLKMAPPDFIKRLPRDLEKHYRHFKASELQSWLLFYSIPCLVGILPDKFLQHFACFVEAIYILLGDHITEGKLLRARSLLTTFYQGFQELYGDGSCGLNVHNAGAHLADFVEGWGPLWAWSCFGFEDMNGTILEFVHGTGNACRQIVWKLHAQRRLRNDLDKMQEGGLREFIERMLSTTKGIRNLKDARNCQVAGAAKPFQPPDELLEKLGAAVENNNDGFFKVLRIVKGGQVYYSKEYTRVVKRNSYTVLLTGELYASVLYYLWGRNCGKVFAVYHVIAVDAIKPFILKDAGYHIIRVQEESNELQITPVDNILKKVILLSGNSSNTCITRMPNLHGLSV